MAFLRRIFFFGLINIAMVVMISAVLRVLGVGNYLTQAGINYQSLAIFCLVWGMVGSLFSLLISKFMAKKTMGVQIVESTGQYASLVSTVHQLATKAGIKKMPEVGIFESAQLNAFATGPTKNN